MGKGKIQSALENRPVQFTGRTGRLSFRPDENKLITLANGNVVQQYVPGFTLEFYNGVTKEFDPVEDAEFIAAVDEFIASGDKRVVKYQIQRVNQGKLVPPWPTWTKQSVKSIIEMVKALDEPDLEHMVGFELQQDEPRTTLIKQLEALADREPEAAEEDLAAVPEL